MAETAPAPVVNNEKVDAHQQLDLTAEAGWSGGPTHPQENPQYRAMEFDVEPLATPAVQPEAAEPLPEIPDLTEPPSEQDWRRIEREAKAYFDEFEDPQDIIDLRQDLTKHSTEVQDETWKLLSELGLGESNKFATQKVQEAVDAAKAKKIIELVEQALPYEEDGRKERKQVDQARESLYKLLNMPQEQFDQLLRDWQQHEISEAHGEALETDKKYKIGEQRQAAKGEIEVLEQKYGGVLAEISRLPLNKEPGGVTHNVLDAYLQRWQKIEATNNDLVDKETLQAVSIARGVSELQDQLKQKYQAGGLNEEQIQTRLAESSVALETWLEHINGDGIPLADLQRYENQRNKEQMLSARRQKASEYIGSILLFSTIRGALGREKLSEGQPDIDVGEILGHGVDHNGSRAKAGGEALSDPEKADSLRGRVMAQLEMARTLSRNESTLMKSLIYYTAVEKSLGNGFVSAWEAIPEDTKKKARKKLMLGMATVSSALSKLSASAAAKARKVAATGVTAGTIWLGNAKGKT